MKEHKDYILRRSLEFLIATLVLFSLFEISFTLLNIPNVFTEVFGFLGFLFTSILSILWIISFLQRVHKYIDNNF